MRIFGIQEGSMSVKTDDNTPRAFFDTKEELFEYMRGLKKEDFENIYCSSSMDFPEEHEWLHDDDPREWLRDGMAEGIRAL